MLARILSCPPFASTVAAVPSGAPSSTIADPAFKTKELTDAMRCWAATASVENDHAMAPTAAGSSPAH